MEGCTHFDWRLAYVFPIASSHRSHKTAHGDATDSPSDSAARSNKKRDQFRDQSALIDRHRNSQAKHDEFLKSLRTVEYQRKGMVGRGTQNPPPVAVRFPRACTAPRILAR